MNNQRHIISNTAIHSLLFLSLILLPSLAISGTSYTWNGGTDSDWATSSNWTPNGVPGSSDDVIVVSATNDLELDQNRTVNEFRINSGTFDLNGYELTMNGDAAFISGTITNGKILPRGTELVFNGGAIDVEVEAICGYIKLNGCTFNEDAYFEDTGYATSSGNGGNIFNGDVTIKHTGSSTKFRLAVVTGDVFNGDVTFLNTSDDDLLPSHADSTIYNGNIYVNNLSTGVIHFGKNNGYSTLTAGNKIAVGDSGYASDYLNLDYFYQLGDSLQELELTGSAILTLKNSSFEGPTDFTAPNLLLKNNVFYGDVILTKTGSVADHSYGLNKFFGSLDVEVTGSARLRMAHTEADEYHGPCNFQSSGTELQIGYAGLNSFYDDVTINHSEVTFNDGGGTAFFTGTEDQHLYGTVDYSFREMRVDKTAGAVYCDTTVYIRKYLQLREGNVVTEDDKLLVMENGATVTAVSDDSYVEGPVKKIGNQAFEFPVGKDGYYQPLSISAPVNTTDEFTAEYMKSPQQNGNEREGTLEFIQACDYWNLVRDVGSSKVSVEISWNENNCGLYDSSSATLAYWDNEWNDLQVDTIYGNIQSGSIKSVDSLNIDTTIVLLAYNLRPCTSTISVDIDFPTSPVTENIVDFFGLNGTNILSTETAWTNGNMRTAVSNMRPSTIRFPGGDTGNWWDWEDGWFIDQNTQFNTCSGLPGHYQSLPQAPSLLEELSEGIGVVGAKPVFMLNMLSSDLTTQLAMLHEAQMLGLPIEYVELGNEFYKEDNCEYAEVFPDTEDYGLLTTEWMNAINDRFPDASISVVGATERINSLGRRNEWNDEIEDYFSPAGVDDPDAYTLHPYKGSGLGSTDDCEFIDFTQQWDTYFFDAYDIPLNLERASEEIDILAGSGPVSNIETWLTEYNLFDRNYYLYGSWAHAMHTAVMTMSMIDMESPSHVLCHAMIGDATFNTIFGNIDGFGFSDPGSNQGCTINSINTGQFGLLSTEQHKLTALGLALKEIGEATRFATEVTKLEFDFDSGSMPTMDEGQISHNAIQAWYFEDSQGNEHIIMLNMSDEVIEIDDFPGTLNEPDIIKTINFGLNHFIRGEDISGDISFFGVSNQGVVPVTGSVNTSIFEYQTYTNGMCVPGFSLTHFYRDGDQIDNVLVIVPDDVCENTEILVSAIADPSVSSYEWFVTGITPTWTTTVPFTNVPIGTTSVDIYVKADGTQSNTETVNPNANPTVTITNTQPLSLCNGNDVTLTTTSSGSVEFCWTPDFGLTTASDPLSSSITVEPDETTTYTVYVSDGTCSASDDIVVTVDGIIEFDPDPIVVCNDVQTYDITPSISGSGWTYQWNSSATTTSIGSLATLNQDPSSLAGATVYTISISDGAGCTIQETVTLYPIECCNPTTAFDYVVEDNSSLADLLDFLDNSNDCSGCIDYSSNEIDGSFFATNNNTLTIGIETDLIIDDDWIFRNVDFEIAERGAIIVDEYTRFEVLNCNFSACSTNMWRGVEVRRNGRFFTNRIGAGNETTIEQAYVGVLYNPFSTGILRSEFIDNYVGVHAIGSTNGSGFDFAHQIFRSSFEKANDLLDVYMNIPALPANGDNGFTGVLLDNATMVIGRDNIANLTTFSDLTNGVIARNSILNVRNSQFSDMTAETAYNSLYQGNGLYSEGSNGSEIASISFTGLGQNSIDLTFEDVLTGINVTMSSLAVSECNMENTVNGIRVANSIFQPIYIRNNTIESNTTGIGLYGVDEANRLDVRDNTVTIDETGLTEYYSTGILLANLGLHSIGRPYRISCNTVNLETADVGIHVSGYGARRFAITGIRPLNISDNEVEITEHDETTDGILITNTHFAQINHNEVNGDDATDTHNTNAYRFIGSTGNVILQNVSDLTKVGFRFEHDCISENNFIGNEIDNHYHGLELNDNAKMGSQEYSGNRWNGYNSSTIPYEPGPGNTNIGASSESQLSAANSEFTVNNTSLVLMPTASHTGWFIPGTDPNQTFNHQANCVEIQQRELYIGELDSLITIDSIYSGSYEDELREVTKYNLFGRLNIVSQFEALDSIYIAFIDTLLLNSLGKTILYIDSLEIETEIGRDSLEYIYQNDSLLHDYLTQYSDELSEYDLLLLDENVSNIGLNLENVWSQASDQYINTLDTTLYDLFDDLSVSTTIETNFKDYYVTLFDVLLNNDDLDLEDVLYDMSYIASQCPFEGGPAVYLARNLISLVDTSRVYDDESNCDATRIGFIQTEDKNSPIVSSSVFPNPFNDNFMIDVNGLGQEVIIKVNVYDLTGRLILTENVNSEIFPYELNMMAQQSGLFFVELIDKTSNLLVAIHKVIKLE